ncbi:MAG: 50S ribosomal protein L18 [Erysipelotrichaceae bacterium]|jgi:large subunit ribosomal protein L18|nr:50S ribosomal protein L18 [Erysipelotrichaceae bacterium]MBQ1304005.1 50S ribosomal protein L18 [Erysipelotrichaceae bacterium]MBQ1757728.1 50S ribosomal protein L18 [Erysipelotrichaceae bacterium]MBQ2214462.1 50S ribosomal protein L18 [Erysipelotrichaceae bacterium]MBQ2685640.1 50S ribosomal protein L18 [Erysipelotrichaceae bacterium]
MYKTRSRNADRIRRHVRVRQKISGTAECPRLNVFRSNANIQAQIIDDVKGVTLVSASSMQLKLENGGNVEAAKAVGTELAKRALEKNIKAVVFDRGGYIYHGRVKALADAAREAGLEF